MTLSDPRSGNRPRSRGSSFARPPPIPSGAAPAQPVPGLALSTEADPGVHDSSSAGSAAPLPPLGTPPGRPNGASRGTHIARKEQADTAPEAEFQNERRWRVGLRVSVLSRSAVSSGGLSIPKHAPAAFSLKYSGPRAGLAGVGAGQEGAVVISRWQPT